jgi:hypothetical protein
MICGRAPIIVTIFIISIPQRYIKITRLKMGPEID